MKKAMLRVRLDENDVSQLKLFLSAYGITMSEYVRASIDALIQQGVDQNDPQVVVDLVDILQVKEDDHNDR